MCYLNRCTRSFYRLVLLFSLVLFLVFPLNAQTFNPYPTLCWFKSNPNEPLARDSMYIGNYKGLDLRDSLARARVNNLSATSSLKSGTLFVVLGTTDSVTTDQALFGFGSISIYRTFMLVLGDTVKFEKDLAKEPGIVRISYSLHRNSFYPEKLRQAADTYVSELIYFKKILSKQEVRKIESYLALKYSINITANTDSRLRDYVDAGTEHLWSARTDAYFDEEVMALGRIDSLDWFQTQTRTADSEAIVISLDTGSALGTMPASDIHNNSVLVLSKSGFSPKDLRCGEGTHRRLWKLKLKDWQCGAEAFYITLNEEISQAEYPMLSNGFEEIALQVKVGNGVSRIRVPFIDGLESNQYFLMWGAAGISCDPLCKVFVRQCAGESSGSIELNVAPEALPAEAELYNLVTNQSVKTQLTAAVTLIENLNTGHYQLSVKNKSLQLVDQVIQLRDCPPPNTLNPTLSAFDEEGSNADGSSLGLSNTALSNSPYTVREKRTAFGISAYPNPACTEKEIAFRFNGLNDRPFKVLIYDDAGAYQSSLEFTPTADAAVLRHDFELPGTYFVRFYAQDFSDFIKVVIHN